MNNQISIVLATLLTTVLVLATVSSNVKAEDDGEFVANPYCDKVKSGESESTGTCHDRFDTSDITGLATCNDGTHEENPLDCEDATEQ